MAGVHVPYGSTESKPCHAQSPESCRYAGNARHFDTVEEADAWITESMDEVSTLSKVSKSSKRREQVKPTPSDRITDESTLHMELSKGVRSAVDDLSEIGTPYLVGGSVRDSILGYKNKDVDIEVHGTDIDSLIAGLRSKGYKVDEVGRSFGVLKVAKRGVVKDLDISVPRRDSREGAGHRGFTVEADSSMSIEEALERRDFTLNAIMVDPSNDQILDPFNGRKDMENKVLRHVSDKFSEDPLRVLRGFQFAGRFGFTMDPQTAELSKSIVGEASDLPRERVREEWKKFYTKSTHPENGVTVLQQTGWDSTIPGLKDAIKDGSVSKSLKRMADTCPSDRREVIGNAVVSRSLSRGLKGDRRKFLDYTAENNSIRNRVLTLHEVEGKILAGDLESDAQIKEAARIKNFSFEDFGYYANAVDSSSSRRVAVRAKELGVFTRPEPQLIDGNDLMKATGDKPGRWVRSALDESRRRQYEGKYMNREEALKDLSDVVETSQNS